VVVAVPNSDTFMSPLVEIWLQFGTCAVLIGFAGAALSRYGDVIGDKAGLSGTWIGLALLATVTSLPELVTGVSSVTIADAPNIAVGDVLGSCVFNLLILAALDFLHRVEPLYHRAQRGHILSAGFGIILIGLSGLGVMLGNRLAAAGLGHVGAYTPLIVLLYLIAIRTVFSYERTQREDFAEKRADRYAHLSLRQAVTRYALAAAVVVGAGAWLPFLGMRLAVIMGWHDTFVGTLFVAGVTSLPELVVTVAAVRIGALDMGVANLLGSNLFNLCILAIDDLLFLKGPLLSHVSPMHAVSALSAMVMNGVVIVGLLYRPGTRLFRCVGWISLALVTLYLVNSYMLFLHGE
jgi:cation:H+ antiporter